MRDSCGAQGVQAREEELEPWNSEGLPCGVRVFPLSSSEERGDQHWACCSRFPTHLNLFEERE